MTSDPQARTRADSTARRRSAKRPTRRKRRRWTPRTYALVIAVVITVIALVLTFVVDRQMRGDPGGTKGPSNGTPTPVSTSKPTGGAAVTAIRDELSVALETTIWPETTPSLSSIVAGYARDEIVDACSNEVYPGVEHCTWGAADAPVSVAIVGDATALDYVPLFRALADASNGRVKVTAMAMYSCPWVDVPVKMGNPSFQAACPERREQVVENVIALRPSVLIVTNTYLALSHYPEGGPVTLGQFGTGLENYLHRVSGSVGTIALTAPPMADKDIRECYSPRSSPQECVSTVNEDWKLRATAEVRWARAVPNAVWVDTRPLFCVRNECPAFAAGIPTKFDKVRTTAEYSRHVAAGMAELLAEQGIDVADEPGSSVPPGPGQAGDGQPSADDSANGGTRHQLD